MSNFYTKFEETSCNALSESWQGSGVTNETLDYQSNTKRSLIDSMKKYYVVFRHRMIQDHTGDIFEPLIPYEVDQSGHGYSMRITNSRFFPSSCGVSRGKYILSSVYLCDEDNISLAIETAIKKQTEKDKLIKVAKSLNEIQETKIKVGLLDVYYLKPFARKESFVDSFMGMSSYSSDQNFIDIEKIDGIWTDGKADFTQIKNFIYYV